MGKIRYDKKNYRKHNDRNKQLIEKSLRECGAGRSVLLDADDSLIAGNGVYEQAKKLGIPVRVIETDGSELIAVKRTDIGEDDEKRRRLALADNATSDSSEWDIEALGELAPIEVDEWGILLPEPSTMHLTSAADEWEEIERKKAEFAERMKAGELDDDDPEYQEFLAKFEAKKTTDDCYTPALVYDAVADWVAKEYGVSRANFVRPFYPGGDYQGEKYKPTDIVVDNPPFSILAEITRFYGAHKIPFFLFAPRISNLSVANSQKFTNLCVGAGITYDNGAVVPTSFITNLEGEYIAKSSPDLFRAVTEANEKEQAGNRREMPKYEYPDSVVTAAMLSKYSKYGVQYGVRFTECEYISELDAQKEYKKAIYAGGLLVCDSSAAEKAAAEKAAAEKAAAIEWKISDRERAIIEKLNHKQGKK